MSGVPEFLFMSRHDEPAVSVVIPTLGGPSLASTIERLNRGSLIPGEILVCIPQREATQVEALPLRGVRVVVTQVRGQVAQRAEGFRLATGRMVLQLDDDIEMPEDGLERLVRHLQEVGPGTAVGPAYRDVDTGACVHQIRTGFRGHLQSVYATMLCGARWGVARMGRTTSIGIGYGIDWNHCSTDAAVRTDWLPGGCVLSFREDLIMDSFFPFSGKAYCEDNIHSLLRAKKGIQHWVIPAIRCGIEVPKDVFPKEAWLGSTAARGYYVKLSNGSRWRAYVYSVFLRIHWRILDRSTRA